MNDFKRHVKSDKLKWIATAVVLFLVVTAMVGMCLQIFGKGKAKPSEWFAKPSTSQSTPADKTDDKPDSKPEDKTPSDETDEGGDAE